MAVISDSREVTKYILSQIVLERRTTVGDSPVDVKYDASSSRAGHVKPCLNMGGPPSKPKYSSVTDSEQVP